MSKKDILEKFLIKLKAQDADNSDMYDELINIVCYPWYWAAYNEAEYQINTRICEKQEETDKLIQQFTDDLYRYADNFTDFNSIEIMADNFEERWRQNGSVQKLQ